MSKSIKKKNVSNKERDKQSWLLILYTVPSRPVKNRMKFWRRLAKAGAVQLKGAVYVLPFSENHYEFCQWLMAEVAALGGEGDFVISERFEMLGNSDIVALFKSQRDADYNALGKKLSELEMKLNSAEKGTRVKSAEALHSQFDKLVKEYSDINQIDFFPAGPSRDAGKKINSLQTKMARVLSPSRGKEAGHRKTSISRRHMKDYRAKVWITRSNPFVDRMASAWLIRKFIDKDASFQFVDEYDIDVVDESSVVFDMKNGEFTHVGDQCTFEVLVRAFGIKDRSVRKMSEIVHALDMKDEKFSLPEAKGIEEILAGIRKTADNDRDALEKGMIIFEMLYSSKT